MQSRWGNIGKVYDGHNSCPISESYTYWRTKLTPFHRICFKAIIMAVCVERFIYLLWLPNLLKCALENVNTYNTSVFLQQIIHTIHGVLHYRDHKSVMFIIAVFYIHFRSCVRATLKNFMITFFFPIIFTTMFLQNFRTPYDFVASSVVVDANPKRLDQQN